MSIAQLPATLWRAIAKLAEGSSTPLLPFVPKWIKIVFLLTVLLNASSFPFMWHYRMWFHAGVEFLKARRVGHIPYSHAWRRKFEAQGGMVDFRNRIRRRALFDDCDYNMHLSNSCYAKNADQSKMQFAIDGFTPIWPTGAFMALGATHWTFMKEIPIGSEYVMETRLAGWGDKWIYLVTEFIMYPKTKSHKPSPSPPARYIPNLSVPPSGVDTPVAGTMTPNSAEEVVRRLNARMRPPRVDGGVVCCVAVSDYCFKVGRVTVPPRVAMWLAMMSPDEKERAEAEAILASKDHGRAFFRGGWKDREDADSLGRNIALKEGSQEWAQRAADTMAAVGDGLAQL